MSGSELIENMTIEELREALLKEMKRTLYWVDRSTKKSEIIAARDKEIQTLKADLESTDREYWDLLEKYEPGKYHYRQRIIDRRLVTHFWDEHEHRYHIVIKGKERHVILPEIMYKLVIRNVVNGELAGAENAGI